MIDCYLRFKNGRVLPAEINYYQAADGSGQFGIEVDPLTSAVEFPPDQIIEVFIDAVHQIKPLPSSAPGPSMLFIDLGPVLQDAGEPP